MRRSVREVPSPTGQPAREVAAHRRAHVAPARAGPVAVSSNAAVRRLVARQGGDPAGGGLAGGGLAAAGNLALRSLVPAGAVVSRPGDAPEREAAAVAARVAAAPPQRPPAAIPRQAGLGGGGAPLRPAVRERIEPHLGVGLAGVPVHTSTAGQQAAVALGARAFTVGGQIYLGPGESPGDLALMAHEATHAVQQQSGTVNPWLVCRDVSEYIPDVVLDEVKAVARRTPGYTLLTVVVGYDPIAGKDVARTADNLVGGLLDLVPFGSDIVARLGELQVIQDAYAHISGGLAQHRLTTERLQREIDQAWTEVSLAKGIDGNVAVVARHVDEVYQDVLAFARSVVAAVVQMIRDAAVGLAERYLAGTPAWELAKKVIHHDPLRDVPVAATTVEIIGDFLRLIGKEDVLAQMQERGTLQQTADWLDAQIARFVSLVGELKALFAAGWNAIQPANLANLPANLQALARDAVGLVQRVTAFAKELMVAVLRLVKDSLLGWLSRNAHGLPGFRLLTVILGQNPFTGEAVPRNAENLIGGFIALLPNGEATYAKLAESGVIAQAAGRIESAMARLGISMELITSTFRGVWDMLSLSDLLDPVGAFGRVLARFGEPLARIVEFVAEVVQVVIELILKLMNFPSDLLGSIIDNALQAIEDIKRDPVGFLMNMLAALKAGLSGFFDNVLSHLLKGLSDWLFRGLGKLGITLPTDLSPKSILGFILQVLGVTMETLWQKLGKHIGPENVDRIRKAIDKLTGAWAFIKDVQERGFAAVWDYVADKLGNLWDVLLDKAKSWIMSEIVDKVVAKLISMLDPTGVMAIINSFIAFFRAVQSAIEYLRDILEIVNRYVTTFAAVAKGNIAPGAAMLEQGFASAIPVAIGFLAKQVGLDNVPEKIVEIIKEFRLVVDEALDWLFEQAIRLGKAALAALGVGGQAEPGADGTPRALPAIDEPFSMKGNQHHIYVATHAGQPVLMMASYDAAPTIRKIDAALKNKTVANDPNVAQSLSTARANIVRFETEMKAADLASTTPEAVEAERKLRAEAQEISKLLILIGQTCDITELNVTQWTVDGAIPKGVDIRATFYRGDYGTHQGAKLGEAHAEKARRQAELQQKFPIDYAKQTFYCPGVPEKNRYPHLPEDKVVSLDHIKSVVWHWNNHGRKLPQEPRDEWYVEAENLRAMCKSCNESKNAGIERRFTREVEIPEFAGPDGQV